MKLKANLKMNKINKILLTGEKGFSWHARYSEDDNTDKFGRWSRICYYNGLYLAWVNGFVKGEDEKLGNGKAGIVDFFTVSLGFSVSSQQHSGSEKFGSFDEAKKYVEEMFLDFKKIINK